jgi:protease-4
MIKQQQEKKSGIGKAVLIIVLLLVLAFVSMIIAGIMGLVFGLGSDKAADSDYKVTKTGNVALVKINGVIMTDVSTGLFDEAVDTSSTELMRRLSEIRDDDSIKAVLFEINSPGGSPVATEEISNAIKSIGKPTVSYIREVGASGAYWVASSTDYIFASRLSFVGSVGVYGSYIEFSGLMERYNVTYQRFVSGKYKDFGVPYRKASKEEKDIFQEQLDMTHQIFLDEVTSRRNLTSDALELVSTGSIFTGSQALDLGLVDAIGSKDDAVRYLEEKLNMTIDLQEYEKETSFFDLFSASMQDSSYSVGRGIGDALVRSSMLSGLSIR